MNFELGDSQSALSLKPNPNVLFKRLGDEIILFHLETDRFYELNGTAARFWELIAGGHDPAQVRQQIMKEFAVEAEQFDAEAKTFLASLKQEDLLIGHE
jgi:hypothetical protein